jgi:hypothetical protein
MTGPEHYHEAEELLSLAANYDQDDASQSAARCRTDAQVHAILALTAATAIQPHRYGMNRAEAKAWRDACHTPAGDDE